MQKLTPHQVRLLMIIDHVRWGEADQLDAYQYHLVRRAMGQNDVVITFEMEQAAKALEMHGPRPSPPMGSVARSPWIDTWNATPLSGTLPTLDSLRNQGDEDDNSGGLLPQPSDRVDGD